MKIILASGNAHKIAEVRRILSGSLSLIPQTELNIPSPAETGSTFVENALIKARHASAYGHLPAIADDSGLAVDHLDGDPGIFSARYAGPSATDAENSRKLLDALAGVPDERRTAHFHCVIVMLRHPEDPTPLIAEGRWSGTIARAPEGDNGFGYDPLFFVPAIGMTVARMPAATKDRLSHRGQALAIMQRLLLTG